MQFTRSLPRSLSLIAAGFLLVTAAVAAGQDSKSASKFPPAGIDLVKHELKIGLFQVAEDGSDGQMLEELTFDGRMVLERSDPYTNSEGYRQIDFLITEWQAFAYSQVLDTMITYDLDAGGQELSNITAQTTTSDFPARFFFSVHFNALAYGDIFHRRHHGKPKDAEFMEVPPSGNRPTSPTIWGFEEERIEMDHPQHGRLRFVPLNCNDTSGKTLAVFDEETGERKLPLRAR